jgi:hypothetical protein
MERARSLPPPSSSKSKHSDRKVGSTILLPTKDSETKKSIATTEVKLYGC